MSTCVMVIGQQRDDKNERNLLLIDAYFSAGLDAPGTGASALVHFAQIESFLVVHGPVVAGSEFLVLLITPNVSKRVNKKKISIPFFRKTIKEKGKISTLCVT